MRPYFSYIIILARTPNRQVKLYLLQTRSSWPYKIMYLYTKLFAEYSSFYLLKRMKSISVSDLIVKWSIGFRPADNVHRKRTEQWRIQDFPGEAPTPEWGASLLFGKTFAPKTVWKWKKLNQGGGGRPQRLPLGSTNTEYWLWDKWNTVSIHNIFENFQLKWSLYNICR